MALSFIGKPISLISHSDVRYRGILAGIDPAASTIQLSNVFSMGTESRRPVAEYIPPVQEPYQYIIFRASEVKDLSVDEQPTPRRSVHDDPAASPQPPVPAPVAAPSFSSSNNSNSRVPPLPATALTIPPVPAKRSPSAAAPNAIHTAAASLETVERALGDLRRTKRNGPADGGGASVPGAGGVAVPTADFDFASMNAKFDKAALSARGRTDSGSSDRTNPSDDEDAKDKGKESAAYNHKSPSSTRCRRHHRLHPRASSSRAGVADAEERERNVATFGEPGGVGLLGPGAYVGGWGGYGGGGRRGGGRRRGPPAVARPQQ
ncbi:Scd6-like Sm domain-containing protein [Mycena leptocephala]|nr:Scd6-like Sm domain-containing protein [Mycena leptocephala]